MSKLDRNWVKNGWEKLCTNRQTNRHYENNGHLAVNQTMRQAGKTRLQWAVTSDSSLPTPHPENKLFPWVVVLKLQDWILRDWTMADKFCPVQVEQRWPKSSRRL